MPGFATHYLFGLDAYKTLTSARLRKKIKENHSAYALGLQGPDLFFYYLPSYLMHEQNIGALAHADKTGEFFTQLLASRKLFSENERDLAIADAYILGFLGHYTLDCATHPYVYAFTGYSPQNPPKHSDYFGQHAYFETEIDNTLIMQKKHIRPSRFHPYDTIRLSPRERHVIVRMLVYAYRRTYPGVAASEFLLGGAPRWMFLGTLLLNDPSGKKKVLARSVEQRLFGHAYLSPMLASDRIHFVTDPMNHRRRVWRHPWSDQLSDATFDELYASAARQYRSRMYEYDRLLRAGFPDRLRDRFLNEYGSLSFLSGLPV